MIESELLADGSILCRPLGSLDWIGSMILRHELAVHMRPGFDVVIDLSRVDSIDSVGISVIMGSIRRARSSGSRCEVRGVSPRVRGNMELAGVYQLVRRSPAPNRDDAA